MMNACRRAAILTCGLAFAVAGQSAAQTAAPPAAVNVTGTVTDAAGVPVPGHIVRLLKTRRVRSLTTPRSVAQEVEEARTKTDAGGRFTLDVPVDNAFPFWYVRFYDPKEFDAVKYVLPPDVEISRGMQSGTPVQVGVVLQLQPDWPKVKALVDEYGPASRRGQILRNLGMPSRRTTGDEGRETWVYGAIGVTYVLQGDTVVETRRTTPAGTPPPGDGTVPAEKVNDP